MFTIQHATWLILLYWLRGTLGPNTATGNSILSSLSILSRVFFKWDPEKLVQLVLFSKYNGGWVEFFGPQQKNSFSVLLTLEGNRFEDSKDIFNSQANMLYKYRRWRWSFQSLLSLFYTKSKLFCTWCQINDEKKYKELK